MTLVLCVLRLKFAAPALQHMFIFLMFDVGRAHVNDMVGVVVGSLEVAKLPMLIF